MSRKVLNVKFSPEELDRIADGEKIDMSTKSVSSTPTKSVPEKEIENNSHVRIPDEAPQAPKEEEIFEAGKTLIQEEKRLSEMPNIEKQILEVKTAQPEDIIKVEKKKVASSVSHSFFKSKSVWDY